MSIDRKDADKLAKTHRVATDLGIKLNNRSVNKTAPCPQCEKDHFSINAKNGKFNCHTPDCKAKGSGPVSFLVDAMGRTVDEACRYLAEKYGESPQAIATDEPEPESAPLDCGKLTSLMVPVTADNLPEYVSRKGFADTIDGLLTVTRHVTCGDIKLVKGNLFVPYETIDGDVTAIQAIYTKDSDKPRKLFIKGSRTAGAFFAFGSLSDNPDAAVLLAEGIATAASVYAAIGPGRVVLCCHSASNLRAVFDAVRQRYPNRKLLIAGDNDSHKHDTCRKACEGLPYIEPETPGEDWNDVAQSGADGAQIIKEAVELGLEGMDTGTAAPHPLPSRENAFQVLPEQDTAAQNEGFSQQRIEAMPRDEAITACFDRVIESLDGDAEARYHRDALRCWRTLDNYAPDRLAVAWESVKKNKVALKKAFQHVPPFRLQPTDAMRDALAQREKQADDQRKEAQRLGVPFVKPDSYSYVTDRGNDALSPQSHIADKMINSLRGFWAVDSDSDTPYQYQGTHWQASTARNLRSQVIRMMDAGAGAVGYKAADADGVLSLVTGKQALTVPEANTGVIPFKNGLLNMKDGKMIETTPDNAQTWCLPYSYDRKADCPKTKAWLRQAVGDDAGSVEFLRAIMAAILTGRSDLQIFFHLVGKGGTGKGTFFRLCSRLVGVCNTHTTSLSELENNRFETANLVGKRLVMIPDASRYGGEMEIFKSITGGDEVRIERKYQDSGSYTFQGIVLMASNTYIETSEQSSGIERRRKTIRFDRVATDAEKQGMAARGGLDAVLQAELPGVVNWLLEMTADEVAQTLRNEPAAVIDANREAAQASNPVLDWMGENCVFEPGQFTPTGLDDEFSRETLYRDYCEHTRGMGRKPVGANRFFQTLLDMALRDGHDVCKARIQGRRGMTGIRLKKLLSDVSSNDETEIKPAHTAGVPF